MNEPLPDNKAILQARARQLAEEPRHGPAESEGLSVVEFLLAGQKYAIESAWVREVFPVRELTPLPCTPPFVLGIMNVRGQILAVVDLRRFFALPISGLTELNKVIILRSDSMELGLLADAILGVRILPLAEIQPPLLTLAGVGKEYLKGISTAGLIVLDAARIVADEKLIVHEEVEA